MRGNKRLMQSRGRTKKIDPRRQSHKNRSEKTDPSSQEDKDRTNKRLGSGKSEGSGSSSGISFALGRRGYICLGQRLKGLAVRMRSHLCTSNL